MVPIKSYDPEKNVPIFLKEGENTLKTSNHLSKNQTPIFSLTENLTIEVLSSYAQKCGIFFLRDRSQMGIYYWFLLFFVCWFFPGMIVSNH